MGIVLDEIEWAKQMISNRDLGKNTIETLTRVAKYYSYNKYSKRDVRDMLDKFLIQCDPTISLPRWSDALDRIVNKALKRKAIRIDHISISKPEMDIIMGLESKQIQRLAFTLLCLAKYGNEVNPNNDNWVTNDDSDIMKMANIRTSIKRQCLLYHNLRENGLLRFSKRVDNTSVRVNYITEGEEELRIYDFRNLGYQYFKYLGEPYFECQNCGIITKAEPKASGRKQKYCKSCAIEVAIKQRVDYAMRRRGDSYNPNIRPIMETF